MLDHILQKRGPKRWPPGFFTGQAGCYCCPPPPPPEPQPAVYYRGYSRREFPQCGFLNFVPYRLPDYLTVTVTSTTCTCLSGLSWQIQRRTLTDTSPPLGADCAFGSAGGSACLGNSNLPFGVGSYNGFGYIPVSGCNSGNGVVGFYFFRSGGISGTDYWVMNFGICGSSEDEYGQSNLNIAPVSINPFVWVMNTEGFGWLFQNFCPNGSFTSFNWVLTVTE